MDRITAELLLRLKAPYTEEDVSASYKRAIRENHPDVLVAKGYSPEDATERAKQINSARDYLLDNAAGSDAVSEVYSSQGSSQRGAERSSYSQTDGDWHSTSRSEDEGCTYTGEAEDLRDKPNEKRPGSTDFSSAPTVEKVEGNVQRVEGAVGAGLVFAIAAALLGVAGLVSTLFVWPPVKLPLDFASTHFGTCAILGPPFVLACSLISWIAEVRSGVGVMERSERCKRLRRLGLACVLVQFLYLAIWAWLPK